MTMPPFEPGLQAGIDQFEAELRDEARLCWSRVLAARGISLTISEEVLRTTYDPLFTIGAAAMYDVLARRGLIRMADE